MKFYYTAKTKDGRIYKGFLEGESREEVFNLLTKYDLIPTTIEEKKEFFSLKKKVSLKDLVFFTRQMGTMLKSSLSVLEALRAQIIEVSNPNLREKLLIIAQSVESGGSLAQALSFYPDVFNEFYLSMIRSGEATGKLSDVFNYLADHLEKSYKLQSEIKSALIYPIFIIIVLIIAIFILSFFVLPQLTPIFENFGEKLPLITKLVLKFTLFFRTKGWIIFLALTFLFFLFFIFLRKKGSFSHSFEKILLKLPIIKDFYKKMQLVNICGNIGALLGAGLPIVQAIRITGEIVQSNTYKEILKETENEVSRGEPISYVFSRYPSLIPSFVVQMISTGEKTGNLEELLKQVENFYQEELNRFTENLPSLIEPVLLVILGIGVGILVIAIFIPIFQIGISGLKGM